MFNSDDLQQLDALSGDQALAHARQIIARLSVQILAEQEQRRVEQVQLKFEQTKNAALNFELARLKQWRFGSSSESMDAQQSLSLPLLSILHSPSIMRPVDPVSAQPSIVLQTSLD